MQQPIIDFAVCPNEIHQSYNLYDGSPETWSIDILDLTKGLYNSFLFHLNWILQSSLLASFMAIWRYASLVLFWSRGTQPPA